MIRKHYNFHNGNYFRYVLPDGLGYVNGIFFYVCLTFKCVEIVFNAVQCKLKELQCTVFGTSRDQLNDF